MEDLANYILIFCIIGFAALILSVIIKEILPFSFTTKIVPDEKINDEIIDELKSDEEKNREKQD